MADVSKIVPKDLDPNKEYVVRVRSVNPLGTKSEWSRGLYVDTSRTSSVAGLFNQTDKELSVLSRDGEVIFGTYAVEGIRNNLIANPSFETNMTGWTALSACTVASVSTEFVYGNNSAEITPAGGITSNEDIGLELEFSNYATVIEGNRYTLSLYVYREYDQGEHGGVNEEFSHVRLKANIYDLFNIKAVVEASEPIRIPNNKWTRLHIEDILIPTGYSASPRMGLTVQLDDSPGETVISVNEKLYVDAVLLEEATELDSYFDGDTVPGLTSWDATDHASTSTFNNPAAGSVFFRGSLTVGGVIRSDNYAHTSGDFSDSGTELELSTGRLRAPNFNIKDNGDTELRGTISAEQFYLKDGSATRGTWSTGESFNYIGGLYDGILIDTSSSNVTAGMFWENGGAGNQIWLLNEYAGTAPTPQLNSISVAYNSVLISSSHASAPTRFTNIDLDVDEIVFSAGGPKAKFDTNGFNVANLRNFAVSTDLNIDTPGGFAVFNNWAKYTPSGGEPLTNTLTGFEYVVRKVSDGTLYIYRP